MKKQDEKLEQNLNQDLDKSDKEEICKKELKENEVQDENLQERLEVENENDKIKKLQDEISEITDKFYRANADFENIKKRMEKDKELSLAYANEKFAKDLLPIIDALEEAQKLDVKENEFAVKIKEGLTHCLSMFLQTLKKHNITQIPSEGEFNPDFHNAINVIESKEHKSGQIVQVYQKGYKYNDRVLRASMVVIAK